MYRPSYSPGRGISKENKSEELLWTILGPQKHGKQLYSPHKPLKRNDEEKNPKGEKLGHCQRVDWSCDPAKASRLEGNVTLQKQAAQRSCDQKCRHNK